MAVVQKTFGLLILVSGVILLVVGLGAAGYGYMDAQDHEEDQGPMGIGEDPDRTQMDQALIAGGLIAAGLGLACTVIGSVLLATARSRPSRAADWPGRTQLAGTEAVVPVLEGHGTSPQRNRNVLIVAGVAAVLLVVSLGVALSARGAGPLGNDDATTDRLGMKTYDGSLTAAGSLAGMSPAEHTSEHSAPAHTGAIRATLGWEPADDQAAQLQLTIQVAQGAGWRDVATKTVAPGDVVEGRDPGLDQARIRIVVAPADGKLVLQQSFTVDVLFVR